LENKSNYPIGNIPNFHSIIEKNLLKFPFELKQAKNLQNKNNSKASISKIKVGDKDLECEKPFLGDKSIFVELTDKGFKSIGGVHKVIERRLNNFVQRKVETLVSPWITNEELKQNLINKMPDLVKIDKRFQSLIVDPDYNQLNMGVFSPGKEVRDEYGLSTSLKDDKQTVGGVTFDDLYQECVETWCDLWLTGVFANYSTEEALTGASVATSLRKMVMTGFITDGARGASVVHELIDEFEKHPKGTFAYSDVRDIITIGFRRQRPGGTNEVEGDATTFKPKYRLTSIMDNEKSGVSKISNNIDLDADGKLGQRVRAVCNHSTAKNVPNAQCNAILVNNLTLKMKRLFTQKVEILNLHKGSLTYCGDVTKYDGTSLRERRENIVRYMFAQKIIELTDHMEHDDILICYDQAEGSESSFHDIVRKRVLVPRSTSNEAFQAIELLTSGSGLTSIIGKTENPADDLRSWCLTLDITPREFAQTQYTMDDDLISWCMVNGGDDRGAYFRIPSLITDLPQEELEQRFSKHAESSPVFRVERETPPKTTGRMKHLDGDNKIKYVTADPVSLLGNQITPEFGLTHPNRSDVVLGLAGSIEAALETCSGTDFAPTMTKVAETLLEIIGCPYDIDELQVESGLILDSMLEGETDDEGNLLITPANAPLVAAQMMGLSNPSRLYYDFTRQELAEHLDEEIMEHIWVSVPERLGTDFSNFLNINNVLKQTVSDKLDYGNFGKKYPKIYTILDELKPQINLVR